MHTILLFLGVFALAAVALATLFSIPVDQEEYVAQMMANAEARENADARVKGGGQTIEQLVGTMNRLSPGSGDAIQAHYDNLVAQAAAALGLDDEDL
jgi:hypothetical protein